MNQFEELKHIDDFIENEPHRSDDNPSLCEDFNVRNKRFRCDLSELPNRDL
jgi:hypothetical protein